MQISCTICREIFVSTHTVLVTNCGHLYHKDCISKWCEKQHSCPQCRAKLVFQPIRIYFNIDDELNSSEAASLESKNSELFGELSDLRIKHQVVSQKLLSIQEEKDNLVKTEAKLKNENGLHKLTVSSLKEELATTLKKIKVMQKLEDDYNKAREELDLLKSVQIMIKGSESDVKEALLNTPCTPKAMRQLLTYVEVLKYQSVRNSDRYKALLQSQKPVMDELASVKRENDALKQRIEEQDYQIRNFKSQPRLVPSSPLQDIINLDVSSPGLSEVPIKVIDKSQVRKHSSETLKMPKYQPSKRLLSNQASGATSTSSYSFDGMGGSKRVSLATPTPLDEIFEMKHKQSMAKKRLKPNEKKSTHQPEGSKTSFADFFHREVNSQSSTEAMEVPEYIELD